MVLDSFQRRGVLLIWIIIRQEHALLRVGMGGDISFAFHLFSVSLSLREGLILAEIMSENNV